MAYITQPPALRDLKRSLRSAKHNESFRRIIARVMAVQSVGDEHFIDLELPPALSAYGWRFRLNVKRFSETEAWARCRFGRQAPESEIIFKVKLKRPEVTAKNIGLR